MAKLVIYSTDDRPAHIVRGLYHAVGSHIDNFQAFCKGYKITEDTKYNNVCEIEIDDVNYDLFTYIAKTEPTCVLEVHKEGVVYHFGDECSGAIGVKLPKLNNCLKYDIVSVDSVRGFVSPF